MSALIARMAISLLTKLITETFLARLLIECLRAWSKTTTTKLDDKVTEAAAAAFGIPAEVIEEASK